MKAFFLFFLSFNFAFSAEVDQFTRRNEYLEDSKDLINKKANDYLIRALQEVEDKNLGCNESQLYAELVKFFANHAKGELTKYILHSNEIKRRTIKIQDSVFKDWTIYDGYLLGRPGANTSELALSPLVKVGEITIGVDKFEHMFGRGFSYFKKHYLQNKSVEKAIKSGVFGEKTLFGGNKFATGVFSYADLSANFNGMRFWNHILQLREDVIGDNVGPYVVCNNGKFEKVKNIDFTHYIDDSMDEAINCSKFPTNKTAKKYDNNVKKIVAENNLSADSKMCPIDNLKVETLKEKYKNYSHYIINSVQDDRTINYFNEY